MPELPTLPELPEGVLLDTEMVEFHDWLAHACQVISTVALVLIAIALLVRL